MADPNRPNRTEPERTPLWEDVAVILSIGVLWPAVLRRETPLTRAVMIAALALLAVILVRRLRRLNRLPRHGDRP